MRYAIKHIKLGYMCENEDYIGGWHYQHEIDEYTILFDKKEDAELNCGSNEIIVEITL